jgi:uncharacterized protein YjbI with pentapeptide repeats
LKRVDFSNALLRLSNFAWNDFISCWFTGCDLGDSDLRGSNFVRCDFSRAVLTECDLRHSSFQECKFAGAETSGMRVSERLRAELGLSEAQARSATWLPDDGPEPAGG